MHYQVSRDGQIYGPYTLEELQRYLASGNVLPTDHAKSDAMSEWQTVAQVLGAAVPGTAAAPSYPGYFAGQPNAWPDPPNMSWVLLLILELVTCGIFSIVYEIVQLIWLRKVQPATTAVIYYVLFLLCSLLNYSAAVFSHGMYEGPSIGLRFVSFFFGMGIFVFLIAYRFAMRRSLEEHFNVVDPVGLRLGPIMTLFFGSLYFQYHFNRISTVKQAVRYRAPML